VVLLAHAPRVAIGFEVWDCYFDAESRSYADISRTVSLIGLRLAVPEKPGVESQDRSATSARSPRARDATYTANAARLLRN